MRKKHVEQEWEWIYKQLQRLYLVRSCIWSMPLQWIR